MTTPTWFPKFGDHIIWVAGLSWCFGWFFPIFLKPSDVSCKLFYNYIYIEHHFSNLVFWSYSSSFCLLGFSLLKPNRLFKVLDDCCLFLLRFWVVPLLRTWKFEFLLLQFWFFQRVRISYLERKKFKWT